MSGGIAYVYDPQNTFEKNLNLDMVTLEALEEDDIEFLRDAVRSHHRETDSMVAARILDRWRTNVRHFNKVMPKDYRRVLDAAAVAEEQGRDVDEAIMASAHG